MNICILGIFLGMTIGNAAAVHKKGADQEENIYSLSVDNETVIEISHADIRDLKCVISENTIDEEDPCSSSFQKLSLLYTLLYNNLSDQLKGTNKLEILGQLKGNIIPIQNGSRTILFHNLKINS